jgi:hypothetical protein
MKDIYRTSRKAPMCSLCGRPIPVGERYRLQTIADNRTVYDWRECGFCEAVLDYVWERQDEISEGDCYNILEWAGIDEVLKCLPEQYHDRARELMGENDE